MAVRRNAASSGATSSTVPVVVATRLSLAVLFVASVMATSDPFTIFGQEANSGGPYTLDIMNGGYAAVDDFPSSGNTSTPPSVCHLRDPLQCGRYCDSEPPRSCLVKRGCRSSPFFGAPQCFCKCPAITGISTQPVTSRTTPRVMMSWKQHLPDQHAFLI